MKQMSTGLVVTVAVGACALMLTACGGGGDSAASDTAGTPAAEPEAAAPASEPEPAESEPTPAQAEPAAEARVVREQEESPYGFYTVQVSSWQTERKARQQTEHYRSLGLEAYVQRVDLEDRGIRYRVRIGRYPSLTEARRAAAALRDIPESETWVDNFRSGTLPPP